MPESVHFRLLPVLICSHMALEMSVFGMANLAYAAKINFTTYDRCLRIPNAITLEAPFNCTTQMKREMWG